MFPAFDSSSPQVSFQDFQAAKHRKGISMHPISSNHMGIQFMDFPLEQPVMGQGTHVLLDPWRSRGVCRGFARSSATSTLRPRNFGGMFWWCLCPSKWKMVEIDVPLQWSTDLGTTIQILTIQWSLGPATRSTSNSLALEVHGGGSSDSIWPWLIAWRFPASGCNWDMEIPSWKLSKSGNMQVAQH